MKNTARRWPRLMLLLALPVMLLAACSSVSMRSSLPPGVEPARAPRLPDAARVSKIPTPSVCLPTCLDGLTRERESWLSTPPRSMPPASAASGTPTR